MPLIVHPLCISVQSLDRRVGLYRERGWCSESLATGSVSLPPAVMFSQLAPVRRTSNKTFPLLPSFSMASINVGTDGGTGLAVTGKCLFLQEHFCRSRARSGRASEMPHACAPNAADAALFLRLFRRVWVLWMRTLGAQHFGCVQQVHFGLCAFTPRLLAVAFGLCGRYRHACPV